MNRVFVFQLAVSFIVGGAGVALFSFIAERASSRVAGIILAFPSTGALSYFFLGWLLSPEAVAEVVPATFIPLGLTALFPVLYVYTADAAARRFPKRIQQIAISISVSIAFWLAFALPIAAYRFSDFTLGILGYLLLAGLANFLIHLRKYPRPRVLTYSFGQKIGRAAFVGLVITAVVFLAKTLNLFWGGVLAMFPAAFSSSIVVLHWYYDSKGLFTAVQKAPVGTLSVLAYSLAAMVSFPAFGIIGGTAFSYLASLAVAMGLLKVQGLLK